MLFSWITIGLDYKVIETNYHIFLLTKTSQGVAHVFETTDPTTGFVSDPKEIDKRIAQYRENRIQLDASNKTYYRYKVDLFNEVDLDQMLGLLHYNLSIQAYNSHKFPVAIEQLEHATKLYHSPRIEEFSKIILLSVIESNLEEQVKAVYVRNIQSLRKGQLSVTASSDKLPVQ